MHSADKPLTLEDIRRNIGVLREGRRSAAPTPKPPKREKKLSSGPEKTRKKKRDPDTVDLIEGKTDKEQTVG